MTTLLNPFPGYAVKRLVVGQDIEASTIVTAAIGKGRELVRGYLKTVGEPPSPSGSNAALCAVRGDFGTGKTHLLNDVASFLQKSCGSGTPPSIVRATCVEADPLFWFRTQIGPQLDALPLYDIVLRLYGQAGKAIAQDTQLTESAGAVLEKDPTRIRELIRANYISVDEVGREFQRLLGEICKDYDPTIRRILSRLVSSETDGTARAWIRGETLTDRDAEHLGVPKTIDSGEQASSVIGAIVALHKAAGRPFLMLMDEFEHFVRYDSARGATVNVTWLKRLLEQLGSAGALALVAGHWSAWQTMKDYLDRFPQHAPIDLVRLEAADVAQILSELVTTSHQPIGEAQSRVIATVTEGNMRRVMSLCNLLFRQTDGFARPLTDNDIHAAWTSVAQRISQEQALDDVTAMLTARDFVVRSNGATFRSVPFDIVAERADGRVLVVELKYSVTQADHYDAARKFIDKLGRIASEAPGVLGLFLANGSIDDELLALLRNSRLPNLRWFDLTERDVMDKVRGEIAAIDGQPAGKLPAGARAAPLATPSSEAPTGAQKAGAAPPATGSAEAETAKLKAMNVELERKLRELDERRNRETETLKERLDSLAASASPRAATVQQESRINPERAHASYEAMLEEPNLDKKLRYMGQQAGFGAGYITVGIYLIFAADALKALPGMWLMMPWLPPIGIAIALLGVWAIWRAYTRVAEYFEFSRQAMRDLYVRDLPVELLSKVNRILRQEINRFGARNAQREVTRRMAAGDYPVPDVVRAYFEELVELERGRDQAIPL